MVVNSSYGCDSKVWAYSHEIRQRNCYHNMGSREDCPSGLLVAYALTKLGYSNVNLWVDVGIRDESNHLIINYLWQEITGAFMKNCMLHYATYRNTFPLWALAQYVSGCHYLKVGCITMPSKHL
ncbi:Lupeol synthase [Vitis vinifera]|uniref:Lupeol synthase n=1 Tax=Vitis vinifera TaxID=29760 RepID=A0A438FJL4_VITVI|nr:Lupeol synthase [Vitis vinifera]